MATKPTKTTTKTTTKASATTGRNGGTPIAYEDKQRMIAETAYFIAERRGFNGGDPVADWVEAEKVVERKISHA